MMLCKIAANGSDIFCDQRVLSTWIKFIFCSIPANIMTKINLLKQEET